MVPKNPGLEKGRRKQGYTCLILEALEIDAFLAPGDNPKDFILSSWDLPEACQHFGWLLGILNIPPEP